MIHESWFDWVLAAVRSTQLWYGGVQHDATTTTRWMEAGQDGCTTASDQDAVSELPKHNHYICNIVYRGEIYRSGHLDGIITGISGITYDICYFIYDFLMEPTLSQKIRNSLIQLVAGIILVWLASWYLSNHPAEWQSIQSSFTTARQKVVQLFSRTDKGVDVASQQTQALSQLKEIIAAIQSCSPDTAIAEYQSLYDSISQVSTSEFARNSINYYKQMSVAYENMQDLCNISPQALDE